MNTNDDPELNYQDILQTLQDLDQVHPVSHHEHKLPLKRERKRAFDEISDLTVSMHNNACGVQGMKKPKLESPKFVKRTGKWSKFVPGRDHVQCLQRWQKVLKPGLQKGAWQRGEDTILVSIIEKVKDVKSINWVDVSKQIKGRTPKQCRER